MKQHCHSPPLMCHHKLTKPGSFVVNAVCESYSLPMLQDTHARSSSTWCMLSGVVAYNLLLVGWQLRVLLALAALAGTALSAAQLLLVSRANLALHISDRLLSLADYSLLSVLAEVRACLLACLMIASFDVLFLGVCPIVTFRFSMLDRVY
jgi:ABC-type uncharacterized transport system permease subunit